MLLPPEFQIFYSIAAAAFGLLFGSFLNVCIYRIARDLSVVAPRSFCPECGVSIAWYDNIPVLSYAILRGRCRHCAKAIGLRYPAVELMTAALFAAIAIRYGWNLAAFKWMIFEAVMVVLFWTDLEERILPDELTIGGAILGLLFAVFVTVPGIFGELLLARIEPDFAFAAQRRPGRDILGRPHLDPRRRLRSSEKTRGPGLWRCKITGTAGRVSGC